jgi:hypothetical protein
MSKIKVTNLKHESSASDNIVLDSSGRVGIGTASPTRPLTVAAGSGASVNILGVFDARSADSGSVGNCLIAFSDPNSTGGQFSTRLGSVGDSLAFYTNGSNERMRILASGGLTFNGDTAAANALDDYEEGSFTPTITGDGFTRTYNSTYTQGRYTKIGRVVTIEVAMYVSSQTGTANGSAPEFNLPFASSSFVSAQHWSLTPLRLAAVASSEIAKIPSLNAMSDTTALRGYYQLSGINNSTSGQVINTSTWGPNYQIGYTLTYVTN